MTSTIGNKLVLTTEGAPLATMTDEELLLAYRAGGDRDLFEELVRRYEREIYSYLRRYLSDPEMAQDAFQTTFLQVHLKCHQYEPGRKVRPWLYTIATHQAIDAQRRNKRHRMVSLDRANHRKGDDETGSLGELLVSRETGPGGRLESSERRDQVRAAVQNLPDQLRSAITLVYYQGLKYREAADALGIPVGTVKSRLHAAIEKLDQALEHASPLADHD
jgi:RNA polymerase sigma-70 factor (ECF subfamily)